MVALRKESVDRNLIGSINRAIDIVALRKESVDRNTIWEVLHMDRWLVALRKESVDRNSIASANLTVSTVALRKESVDRNGCNRKNWVIYICRSPQGERG